MVVDEFSVELNLHHPSCDPQQISEQLSLTPWFAVKHGTSIGGVIHSKTAWLCRYRRGNTNPEFATALEDVTSLLTTHRGFISGFIEQGGNVELVLNSATDSGFRSGDKLAELTLHPWFLKQLAESEVHLRLQVWVADSKRN